MKTNRSKQHSQNRLRPPMSEGGKFQLGTVKFIIEIKYLLVVGLFMVLNTTFNNMSVISWRSGLLVDKTGVPGENHRSVASHSHTLSHNIVSSTSRHERGSNSQLYW